MEITIDGAKWLRIRRIKKSFACDEKTHPPLRFVRAWPENA
jgi:hypothetical protein